ncbi:TPA: helix-turn-helix domain-containing protein [Clostridioides difficile]|nr:helix-turn-helix domain-containing protein [Clostridioides difficile]MDI6118392.1 helix-turn-helix domain-containing protein [Clostridioides difficile]MDI6219303.1 helix-turn-helix domain-containing protein [Clostridioides difficile]MDN9157812.1 helix-turn-helix domain-containing protein [Clostridioides difficile]MDO0129797.1 helix-turn-helix domain-containing protein [Clostridioides difficile]
MSTIAQRIKKGLELRDMKQSELVKKAGIPKSALSSYISGKYKPKQDNIYKIAKALDVNEAWLMGCDVEMERTEDLNKNKEIGKRIKDARENLGLTLKDIAECVGVAVSTIQRYEKGEISQLKLPVLASIAKALNVDLTWITNGIENKSTKSSNEYNCLSKDEKVLLKKYRILSSSEKEIINQIVDSIFIRNLLQNDESEELYIDYRNDHMEKNLTSFAARNGNTENFNELIDLYDSSDDDFKK